MAQRTFLLSGVSLALLGAASSQLVACGDAPQADGGFAGSETASGGALGSGGSPLGSGGSDLATGGTTQQPEPTLLWSDEFEGSGLPNSSNWNFETQGPGWVNNELQNYTGARTENVRLENGSLVIEARRDYFNGHEYSSARVHSAGKATFGYGRFEARAKLPRGLGTWPAIWMMPNDPFKFATTCTASTGWIEGCDAWPNSGEIDFMEHVGYDPGNVHGTIHCSAYNWQKPAQKTTHTPVEDVFDTFHVYAVEKRPDRIDMFIDGEKFFSYKKEPNAGWQSWPFDEPFYFIFNIAVGGSWGGAQGVDPAAFPTRLEVDWIRVYELSGE